MPRASLIGIRFGVVKQGFGRSNTGNMAKNFFSHPKTVAETLNLSFELVKRLAIIMIVISCQLPINVPGFKAYLARINKIVMVRTFTLVYNASYRS